MVLKVGGMGSIYKVVGISRGGGKFSPRGSTKLSEFHFMGTFRVFILAIFTIMINSNNWRASEASETLSGLFN